MTVIFNKDKQTDITEMKMEFDSNKGCFPS